MFDLDPLSDWLADRAVRVSGAPAAPFSCLVAALTFHSVIMGNCAARKRSA